MYTGPTSSPEDISLLIVSPTTVAMSWGEIPSIHQNGIILFYKVFCRLRDVISTKRRMKTQLKKNETQLKSIVFTDLLPNMNYDMSVQGYTGAGGGSLSEQLSVLTPQDGKLLANGML